MDELTRLIQFPDHLLVKGKDHQSHEHHDRTIPPSPRHDPHLVLGHGPAHIDIAAGNRALRLRRAGQESY